MIGNFNNAISQFQLSADCEKIIPYGFGHINDTYAVYAGQQEQPNYILQRINHNIFKDPSQLMSNINGVTQFLRKKVLARGGNPLRECLSLVPTKDGDYFYHDADGNYWRTYIFITDAQTYQIVENPNHLYQSGRAFGAFQNDLSDYPAEELYETIPFFHDTKERLADFKQAVALDVCHRAKDVQAEIDFIMDRGHEASKLVDMLANKELPLRVTHNDTKFNNVMIDNATGKGICVIDLDTVMPGSTLYDYGDSIRSGTNPADEDEKDLDKVCMDNNLYTQFTKGFLEEMKHSLTENEINLLPLGAKLMTYECGMRFLADYLKGDVYFKIHRDGHNLDRARTQFKMVADMESKWAFMQQVINDFK